MSEPLPDPKSNAVLDLKRRLEKLSVVKIEDAADLIGVSTRTVRRHLHLLEFRRSRGHIWISLRSIEKFIVEHRYQPSRHFDAR